MTSYTVHTRHDRPPVLLAEGWSWGAALLGPLWFLVHRAWISAVLFIALIVVVRLVMPRGVGDVIGLGLIVAAGLMGRDVLRWSLEQRGYALEHVLVARDHEGALGRLLHAREDLRHAYHEQIA